jgi:hypothetical protein
MAAKWSNSLRLISAEVQATNVEVFGVAHVLSQYECCETLKHASAELEVFLAEKAEVHEFLE